MAVRYKLSKEEYDALSDAMKDEYNLKNGEYILDLSGIDLSGPAKYEKERDKRRAAETRAEKAEKELDTFKDEDDRPALIAKHAKEVDRITKERDGITAEFHGVMRNGALDSATAALASKLSSKHSKLLTPHIAKRLDVDMTDPKAPKVIVLGTDGKPAVGKTTEDLYKEMLADKDFAGIVEVSQASGGAASRASGNGPRGVPAGPHTSHPTGAAPDLGTMDPASLRARIDANGGPRQRPAPQ